VYTFGNETVGADHGSKFLRKSATRLHVETSLPERHPHYLAVSLKDERREKIRCIQAETL